MQLSDLERPDVIAALRQMAIVHAAAAADAAAQADTSSNGTPTVKDRDIRSLLATSVRLRAVATRLEGDSAAAAPVKAPKPRKAAPVKPPPIETVLGTVDDDPGD